MDDGLVQYYVARQGASWGDGALALLAARAALLGQARWSGRADYRHWRARIMTKVVLEATADDLARIRAEAETVALSADGAEAQEGEAATLIVLPPRPREGVAPLIGHLRLAAKRRGRAPEPDRESVVVLVAAGDLGMHGGKLAAQVAHAALHAEEAYGNTPE